MKIAVIGAGAMGSVYARLLADAVNEVWVNRTKASFQAKAERQDVI